LHAEDVKNLATAVENSASAEKVANKMNELETVVNQGMEGL
jgi:hypothetical protein